MEIVLLLSRIVLAGTFGVAGLAKLADLTGSWKAVTGFGVPERIAKFLGLLLPIVELAIGLTLLTTAFGWYGAVAALALLVVFLVAISVNMALGRNPDCHCFGQLHSAPAGPKTVVRNGVFALLALFLVLQGPGGVGPGLIDWLALLGPTERVLVVGGVLGLAILAGEGWLLLMLLRQNGRLILRIDKLEDQLAAIEGRDDDQGSSDFEGSVPAPTRAAAPSHRPQGLPVGSPAPSFRLPELHGVDVSLEALLARELPIFLLFMDPRCGPCNALMPEVGRWQREQEERLTIAVISRGKPEANRSKVEDHGLRYVLLQKHHEVADAFKVHGTPGAVLVRADGTIGSPAAVGADAIRDLYARSTGQPTPMPARAKGLDDDSYDDHDHHGQPDAPSAVAKLGDPAPLVSLPDLDGRTVDLANFLGNNVLILFWNQGCGFCQRMLPELREWEAKQLKDAPKLLVVSSSARAEHASMNLRSPILLDPAFAVGRSFGANGTPVAVLVDAKGRVASQLAVGANEVMALAVGRRPPLRNGPTQLDVPTAPVVGEPAPDFALDDLDGKQVSLASFRGSQVLVLFWNPGCGFCQRMLPDLKSWEAGAPPDAPKLVVISSGTVEANQAQGINSPVLLDQGFQVGNAFGARGTPSGVLVDAHGKIAAPLAVGAQAVLALADARHTQPSAEET